MYTMICKKVFFHIFFEHGYLLRYSLKSLEIFNTCTWGLFGGKCISEFVFRVKFFCYAFSKKKFKKMTKSDPFFDMK